MSARALETTETNRSPMATGFDVQLETAELIDHHSSAADGYAIAGTPTQLGVNEAPTER